MHVIATAGHVDHGKSALVCRLTGTQPDRLAEEQRRGLTIDLGFASTTVEGETLAFVDVPGHERFVSTMLCGAGPAPSVLFVVAADEGWQPQSAEHLAALDAFGVTNGLLAVTKSDLTDPGPATAEATEALAASSLGQVPTVAVSARTGEGFDRLARELLALAGRAAEPDTTADVRLWVDRSFTLRGTGTVVTGTLEAGTIAGGDDLLRARDGARCTVRGLHTLGEPAERVPAMARVAVNLKGVERAEIGRGDALLSPGRWLATGEFDVRLRGAAAEDLPGQLILHLGAASLPVHLRPLGTRVARLRAHDRLPLRVGDVGLLRDPGRRRIACGIEVLDVRPPSLRRRGAARERAEQLATAGPTELAAGLLRREGFVATTVLTAMGLPEVGTRVGTRVGAWLADPAHWAALAPEAARTVQRWQAANPLAAGMPAAELAAALGLPKTSLLSPLIADTALRLADGRVRGKEAELPGPVDAAVRQVEDALAEDPFRPPAADRLAELGLGSRELAAAERAGRLVRLAEGVVLRPDALARAEATLGGLAQPFTASEAKTALGTTRRVAVPLLERLDADGVTERLADSTRHCHAKQAARH